MFEKILLINFIVQLVFSIFFVLWQLGVFTWDEIVNIKILSMLDLYETIILVFSRFIDISGQGKLYLGAFYGLQIVMLSMQFIFAEWGIVAKIRTVLWIFFYIILFMIDIVDFPIFNIIYSKINAEMLLACDNYLKDSWIGNVLEALILAFFKMIFDFYFLRKKDCN